MTQLNRRSMLAGVAAVSAAAAGTHAHRRKLGKSGWRGAIANA